MNSFQGKSLQVKMLLEKATAYQKSIQSDDNARLRSWEHCFIAFTQARSLDNKNIENLCLHLAFYLASWGMYRGSSFLLQKDFWVHKDAVLELLQPKYDFLVSASCEQLADEAILARLFQLAATLNEIYVCKRSNIDGRSAVSEILITKILLGTLGCVPAYDRFLLAGLKECNIASGTFCPKSIMSLACYYLNNKAEFEKCRNTISSTTEIPQMKLIDMALWQLGYDSDIQKEITETK